MPQVRRTVCNRDCPDTCSILVTLDGDRATALRGDPDDPITRGFLCERTNLFLHRQYRTDRFVSPMLRRDGSLEPISWDAALDIAADKLLQYRREDGPAAILHYKSGGSLGILRGAAKRLFEQFGPVTEKRGDICSGAGEAAQERDFGRCDSSALTDIQHARTILLWGKNPHASGPHLIPLLNQARRNGARVIGIDPVRTRAARVCDSFLTPRPGADFSLAMAIARHLFDDDAVDPDAGDYCNDLPGFRALAETRTFAEWAHAADVPIDDAHSLAVSYARDTPATILVGWGMGRRRNGSTTIRALDAIAAVSGNVGVPGGSVSYYFARGAPFDPLHDGLPAPRTLAEARLGREILDATDPPIRMIWVTAGNPLSMLPDATTMRAAFEETAFKVVVDTHPTDTTDAADLILPTLTLLEDEDVFGAYGNHYLRASTPALEPPRAADGSEGPRHELHILQGLAERLGLAEAMAGTIQDWKRRATGRLRDQGVRVEDLESRAVMSPLAEPVLFAGRKFATADGKANLLTAPAAPPPTPTDAYPLTLLAVSTPKAQSSQWALGAPEGPIEARVHAKAADGFVDGDIARLETALGAIDVTVRVDDDVRPDVVLLPKGGMMRDGQCANALIAAVETDDGGGAAYYDQLARLSPR